jgi:phosphopantetheinyl transferase (holo-ACP synthase)
MSAKDKAKELMDKYQYAVRFDESETQYFANMHSVKECALIAVDEILKQCWDYRDIDLQASYDYWQEVKQEIELL